MRGLSCVGHNFTYYLYSYVWIINMEGSCKNFSKEKFTQEPRTQTQAHKCRLWRVWSEWQCIQYAMIKSTLGVPVYKGLWDTSRMPSNQHHDKAYN